MKKRYLVLPLLFTQFVFADFNDIKITCKMETPPTIEFEQHQFDQYLFTSSYVKDYNVNEDWIDPNCYPRHFAVTNPYENLREKGDNFAIEAWYRQDIIWETDDWSYVSLLGSIASENEEERYVIFQGSSYGSSGPFTMVFQTYPVFNFVFGKHSGRYLNKDNLTIDGFITLEEASIEEAEAICGRVPSRAGWPWRKIQHKFKDSTYTSEVLSEPSC